MRHGLLAAAVGALAVLRRRGHLNLRWMFGAFKHGCQ